MRKSLIILLVVLLAVPVVFARKPKEKAGKVSDNVYIDNNYNFEFPLPEDWKYKIEEKKDNFRVIMTQVNYDIPADYIDAPDYTKIPRIVIYADTSSKSAQVFLDSLVSETYNDDQKKNLMKEFEILNIRSGSSFTAEDLITREKKNIDIAGERGRTWTGQVKYRNEVATSASSMGAKRVSGAYGGAIFAVQKDNRIILIHMICEWNYFEDIYSELMKIVQGLKLK